MDNTVLRKKLNTYKSAKGSLKRVSDDVTLEVLLTWQNWPGTTADLYRDLSLSKGQMSALIRSGKKLVKNGVALESDFKEVEVEGFSSDKGSSNCIGSISMNWKDNKVINFTEVDQLVDFLKKVA